MGIQKDNLVIRSSEIAQYVYDPKLWWQSRTEGTTVTEQMIKGEKFHEDYQQRYESARGLEFGKNIVLAVIVLILLYLFIRWLL
ncbi:MAG: hypothetical protein V1859_02430 [archaeon]